MSALRLAQVPDDAWYDARWAEPSGYVPRDADLSYPEFDIRGQYLRNQPPVGEEDQWEPWWATAGFTFDPLTTFVDKKVNPRSNDFHMIRSPIDGVLEWRQRFYDLPHAEATANILKIATTEFHEALHSERPYWSQYVERRTVKGELVETRHWVPIDLRHERDQMNLEHVLSAAIAMVALVVKLPNAERTIDFVDAHNHVHTLTATQAIETLWPVVDWMQEMWSAYQKRKSTIRFCIVNQELRDLAPAVWPDVPEGPSEKATLARLGVSVGSPNGPVEHLATIPNDYDGDVLIVDVPRETTGYHVIATPSHEDASIRMDGTATRAFPATDDEACVLVAVFSSDTSETLYRLMVRRETEENSE